MLKYFSNPYVACTIVFIALCVNYAANRPYPVIQEVVINKTDKIDLLIKERGRRYDSKYFMITDQNKIYQFPQIGNEGIDIVKDYKQGDFFQSLRFQYNTENCAIINNRQFCSLSRVIQGQYYSQKYNKFYDIQHPTDFDKFMAYFGTYLDYFSFYVIMCCIFFVAKRYSMIGKSL